MSTLRNPFLIGTRANVQPSLSSQVTQDRITKIKKRRREKAGSVIRKVVKRAANTRTDRLVRRILTRDTTFDIGSNEFGGRLFRMIRDRIGDQMITLGSSDGKYRTLSFANLNKLIKQMDSGKYAIEDSYSDSHYLRSEKIVNSGRLTTEIIRSEVFERVPWQGTDINGSFFRWFHLTTLDLGELQIFSNGEHVTAEQDSCFVFALIQSGQLNDDEIQTIRQKHVTRNLSQKKIKQIAEQMGLYITVTRVESNKTMRHYGEKTDKPISLALVDNHYFIIKPIDVTSFALENYEEIKHLPNWHKIAKRRTSGSGIGYERSSTRQINSYKVVQLLMKHKEKLLRLIPKEDLYETLHHNVSKNIECLDFNSELATRWKQPSKCSGWDEDYIQVSFDFEASTDGDCHVPYGVRCSEFPTFFTGHDCGLKMLKALSEKYKDKHFFLVAHNLGYDFRHLEPFLKHISLLERGTSIMRGSGTFKHPNTNRKHFITVQDSWAFLSCKLAKFGEMFNLKIAKEILPYSIYTEENVRKRYLPLEEVLNNKEGFNKEDFEAKLREQNCFCKRWNKRKWSYMVDIIKYSSYYCGLDVDVLHQGWEKFREWIKEAFEVDVNNFCSAAQLANYVMGQGDIYGTYKPKKEGQEEEVVEPVLQVALHVRSFIQQAMVGGRTMTCENKKWWVKKALGDFDAVSLYPSAMYRLGGYLIGEPKVITNTDYDDLKTKDGYFAEIRILHVGIKRKFPLLSKIDKNGGRHWNNDMVGEIITVDKTSLEDLIHFQKIKFEIIRGYYFDEGRNMSLRDKVLKTFQERKKWKAEKNPIEQVFKLILNSPYGKTL